MTTRVRSRASGRLVALALGALLTPLFLVATTDSAFAVESTCEGIPSTIIGSDGSDFLIGTDGNDVFSGGQGNDLILGLGGNDVICGGQGDDTIYAADGFDFVNGGGGNDGCYDAEVTRNCE